MAADEVASRQLFDLNSVEGLGIELPVESFQCFALGKNARPGCAESPRARGGRRPVPPAADRGIAGERDFPFGPMPRYVIAINTSRVSS